MLPKGKGDANLAGLDFYKNLLEEPKQSLWHNIGFIPCHVTADPHKKLSANSVGQLILDDFFNGRPDIGVASVYIILKSALSELTRPKAQGDVSIASFKYGTSGSS